MKEGTRYLKGAVVKLSCNAGYKLIGSEERICQENGQWSGETTDCVAGKSGDMQTLVMGDKLLYRKWVSTFRLPPTP